MIYFVRNPVTHDIKIGHGWDVRERVRALSKAAGVPLELIAKAPGGRRYESIMHAEVWGSHIGHEWFRASRKLDRLAKAVAAGTFNFASAGPVISPLRRDAAFKAHATRRSRLAAA